MDEQIVTTQLTSKRLKFNKLVSWACITIGAILILTGAGDSKHSVAWGSLICLYGFGHLTVTRIRVWWNHK
jgi:hypothetical protein